MNLAGMRLGLSLSRQWGPRNLYEDPTVKSSNLLLGETDVTFYFQKVGSKHDGTARLSVYGNHGS